MILTYTFFFIVFSLGIKVVLVSKWYQKLSCFVCRTQYVRLRLSDPGIFIKAPVKPRWPRSKFLNLSIVLRCGDCAMYYKMFSSTPGLCQPYPELWRPKLCPDIARCSLRMKEGDANHTWLRTTDLDSLIEIWHNGSLLSLANPAILILGN